MRIALATNVLKIPPTYFAINHATVLADRHEFEMFALAAYVSDPNLVVPIQDCALLSRSTPRLKNASAAISSRLQSDAIARFDPDVVHLHFGTWSSGPISGAARADAPLITTLHGYDVMALTAAPTNLVGRWHRRNVRKSHQASAKVLAVSRYLADHAVTSGMRSDRLEVHYQGIDTDFFTPSPGTPPAHEQEAPTVLFVGVLATRKGPRDLIAASRALIGQHDHRLVLMGSGPLESELRRETESDHHITITGSVSRERIRDAMRDAAMLVLPTQEHRGWREAAGLVLLEAQACGTPVIAYDSGGVREMLEPERTGLLVAEKDAEGLQSAVKSLLVADSNTHASLSREARQFVTQHRSLRASADELEAHYSDVT